MTQRDREGKSTLRGWKLKFEGRKLSDAGVSWVCYRVGEEQEWGRRSPASQSV